MRLTKEFFFDRDTGEIRVTDEGWKEICEFSRSIVLKYAARRDYDYIEDSVSKCALTCIERLDRYNPSKNPELGAFLYWVCRGALKDFEIDYSRNLPYGDSEDINQIKEKRGIREYAY